MSLFDTKTGITFREFLNQSTNLLTIFAIFNGLFIYSTSVEPTLAASILKPVFYILSLIVWLEILLFMNSSFNGSIKYLIFGVCATFIQFGLLIAFVSSFKNFVIGLGSGLIVTGITIGVANILVKFMNSYFKNSSKIVQSIVGIVIIIIASGILIWLYLIFGMPYLESFYQKKNAVI